ncbi:MAG: hypothetical protein JW738_09440 [Actinobacteria bacterium]|nr:hypothetical protein [Actinomycetota bacterium]
MSRKWWYVWIAVVLIAVAAGLYLLHFAIFHDSHHIYIYMLGDLAFLPLEVLLVTVIVDRLLSRRDKRIAMNKLNMVIGAFFSQVGTELLRELSCFDDKSMEKHKMLNIDGEWTEKDFLKVKSGLSNQDFYIDSKIGNIDKMKLLLVGNRDFMVRLIENPLLLEHETFTDLLWAVFHLTEELDNRMDCCGLSDADYKHLSGDIKRVYSALTLQWLSYMDHLRISYPYLFSLAMRINPFNPEACAEFV